jgi:hypothetical protein
MAGMFVLLVFIALATAGLTGYVIFAPLTWRHLLDRGWAAQADGSPITPGGLWWLLRGRFAQFNDRGLNGLGRPAQILGWCLVIGLLGCAVVIGAGIAP